MIAVVFILQLLCCGATAHDWIIGTTVALAVLVYKNRSLPDEGRSIWRSQVLILLARRDVIARKCNDIESNICICMLK